MFKMKKVLDSEVQDLNLVLHSQKALPFRQALSIGHNTIPAPLALFSQEQVQEWNWVHVSSKVGLVAFGLLWSDEYSSTHILNAKRCRR